MSDYRNKYAPDHDFQSKRSGRQKLETSTSKQVHVQFIDDTWERLLNSLERLEQVTEDYKSISASRLDSHADRDCVKEDEASVRSEVHLQIKCLQRLIHSLREESLWMIKDFLSWYGGRNARPFAATDEYALPIVLCILGEQYDLPVLPDPGPVTQAVVMSSLEAVARGLIITDEIEEKFIQNPDLEVTTHRHERGSLESGLRRFLLFYGKPSGPVKPAS
jgi:hypothetical protein